jgi:glycosyltransferase involved in cell wall biosynthesis
MKIVFFGNAPEKIAAIRYRIIRFAEMLEEDGHDCVICLPSSTALQERLYTGGNRGMKLLWLFYVLLRRIAQVRHVIGADAVYFRGPVFPYGPPVFERIIRLFCPRLVYDIDDAIWEPPAYVESFFVRFMDFGWVRKMARICVHGVVGNEHLADYVRRYNPAVTIIPTCIDMRKHVQKEYRRDGGPIILGWTGLSDNLGYMKPIEGVLRDLAVKHGIRILVASGREYHLDGVDVENHDWKIADEIWYLSAPDIGLMPLEDTPRARGKCAFKALQYMGTGTPAVLSPVGMNASVIEDGVDGFLADDPEEWREKLEKLITDPDLRERMGRAAREKVMREYSHAANYPKLKAMFKKIFEEG